MKKKLFGILIIVCILSLILVACGTSVDVTINFDSNGGSAVSSLSLGNDMTITMPEDPTKDGYVFAGWYWDNNTFQEEFTAGSLLTAQLSKDMTVYAKWISEEQSNADFTVTFNSKSGTPVEAITTSYGSLLLEPTAPTRSGFYFGGWFRDEACLNKWDFSSDTVVRDITLYAKWIDGDPTDRTYTVVFYYNGDIIDKIQNVSYNSTISEISAPVKPGYVFKGWYTSEAYTNRWYFDEDVVKGTTKLYAKYIPEAESTYTVEFNTNGGTAIESYYDVLFNSTISKPGNSLKDGYAVTGWYTDSTLSTEWNFESDVVRSNLVLYAKWAEADTDACDIIMAQGLTINAEQKEVYGKVANVQKTISFFDIIEVSPFASWSVYNDLQGKDEVPSGTVELPVGDTVKYILVTSYDSSKRQYYKITVRRRDIYSVTVVPNNGDENYIYQIEEDNHVTPPTLSKKGYSVEKWMVDEEEWNMETDVVSSDTIINTVWKANSYSVTINSNGGNDVAEASVTYDAEYSFTAPEKTGYTFIEWYTVNANEEIALTDGSGDGIDVWNIDSDVEVFARWQAITYSITYQNTKGADNNNPVFYTIEDEIIFENIEKDGYIFIKWEDEDENAITGLEKGSIGNKTVIADWTVIVYNITFVMENEQGTYDGHYADKTNPSTYTAEDTFTFIEPVCDIRGYKFKGWYTTKNESGEKVGGVDHFYGDKTYYAQWTREEYTISYYGIDHATNSNLNSYNVETPTFTLEEPTKLGYSFLGWYTSDEYDQIADTTIEVGSVGNLSFYAKWELTGYTIDYVLYGGTNNVNNPVAYTMEDSVAFQYPTRDDYSFGGWFTNSDFATEVTEISVGTTGNITLYAKWHWIATVTFDSNGGSAVEAKKQAYGTTLTAPTAPTRDYYIFIGWFIDLSDEEPYPFGTMPDEDFTLIAKWDPIVYTINYHLNEGINGDNPVTYTTEDVVILANANKVGYSFVAWYLNAEFTSVPVEKITIGSHGDIDLYANYSINQYTISFDSNGGSAVTSITQDYDTIVDEPANPAKTGYHFDGWYTENNERFVFDRMPASDSALKAKWTAIAYTINYGLSGGTNHKDNPATYTIENDTIVLQSPQKRGYTFDGWFTDMYYTEEITEIPAGSHTVVDIQAKWTIVHYTITYENCEGLVNNNPETYTVEDNFAFEEIEKLGHNYHGLFAESTFVNQKSGIEQGSVGDIVLYAKYTVNSYDLWMDGKENPEYTVSFDVVGGNETYETQTISASTGLTYPGSPTKAGYIFAGWYDNAEYTGASFAFNEEVNRNVSLFAKWVSSENNIVSVNDSVNIAIAGKTELLYSFIPLISGDVSVTTAGSIDTYGSLYEDETLIKQDDDNGSDSNFLIKYNVTAGRVYTVSVRGYSVSTTGNVTLSVSGDATVPAGGKAQEAGNKITVTFGESFTLSSPTKDGYIFRGWADENGVMYTDATGASIKNFDKGEETVFYSQWDFDGFTVSFVTNGGTAVEDDVLARGARLDINRYVTTRANYSFLGWYLSVSDAESYNASVMPDHDVTLYARWTSYALNAIKYDEAVTYVSQYKEITAEDFGATCFDNGGNLVPMTVAISGTQEAGNTITVRFTATNNGKTKTATISGVKVYDYPTLTIGESKDYFNLKDGLTAAWFSATAKDTYDTAIVPVLYIEGDYAAGDTVTVKVKATDIAGNVTEQTVENVKVYGLPVISSGTVTAIKVSDTLTPELLAVTATDSFGVSLTPTTTLYSGTQNAGNTIRVKLYAIDSKGNATTDYIDIKVHGFPIISEQTVYDFKVDDIITPISLGLSAVDSHGGVANVEIALISGVQTAGQILTFLVTATDIIGNVSTSIATANIYGTPLITYERQGLLLNEDIHNIFIQAILSFDLNGGTGEKPIDQIITESKGMIYPTSIPLRPGYVFKGWYTTAACTELFDFTTTISEDTVVYAGWKATDTTNYYFSEYIDVRSHNNNSTLIEIPLSETSSSSCYSIYFTALTAGSLTFNYKTNGKSVGWGINRNDHGFVGGHTSQTSYSSYSFTASAGDVFQITCNNYENDLCPIFYFYFTGTTTPSDGGLASPSAIGVNINPLLANAIDSFGKTLDVNISLHSGDVLQKETYVTYDITASDHLGNTMTITTAELGVYDIEDIRRSLVYNAFNTDIIKLSSHGEEFEAIATDSFGNSCNITLKQANGNAIVAGQVQNIIIVATDVAGNEVISDAITNIGVYDVPTITYDSAHISYETYFIKSGEDMEFLFTGHDSFGEELPVTLSTVEETSEYVKVSASVTDDAQNNYVAVYTIAKLASNQSVVALFHNGTKVGEQKLTKGSGYSLPHTFVGYTFIGWQYNNMLVTDSNGDSLSFWDKDGGIYQMTAKTTIISYNITYNLNGGTNCNNPTSYTISSIKEGFLLNSPTRNSVDTVISYEPVGNGVYRVIKEVREYSFLGWYTEEAFVNRIVDFDFYGMDVVLYAKWNEIIYNSFTLERAYDRSGDYIYFGYFPQTLKRSDVVITSSVDNRGYYLGSDGEYYAKVVAEPNSYGGGYSFSNGTRIQSKEEYYFKVEPVRWYVISEDSGNMFILCDSIISCHDWNSSFKDDYTESSLYKWLRNQFYENSFSLLQQYIMIGRPFLLNFYETGDINNNFLIKKTTDYSRANGAKCEKDYNGYWWILTTRNFSTYSKTRISSGVSNTGQASYSSYTNGTNGVVPCLKIKK